MQNQPWTTWQRFAAFTPDEFADAIDERLETLKMLLEPVKQAVSENRLSPLEGAKIASGVFGNVIGYDEFHTPQPSQTNILQTALMEQLRERDLAGTR